MLCNECRIPMTPLDPRKITDPQPSRYIDRWECNEKECPAQGRAVTENTHILYELKALCEYIAEMEPRRRALTNYGLERGMRNGRFLYYPKDIDRRLRDGVIFYSTGWGWRLRKEWQMVLEGKLAEDERLAS